MHALGVEAGIDADADAGRELVVRQEAIFDQIVIRRGCLAIDLLRVPVDDLMAVVSALAEGHMPTRESLLGGLRRYVNKKLNC